jgi:hypothetical protein
MEDVLITEHAGTRKDAISRIYQYGGGGVRVLDAGKSLKRLYLFDPVSDIMTERDPLRQGKILRRFVFDRYGMLEETFASGQRSRTFRYENGGRQIAVREGGDYGAVGKIITFENDGITETAWGRNGEIEHVYRFDANGDAITVRAGGWYGSVERTILFAGREASLFFEPESFLQFLMFTEWSAKDRDDDTNERVAQIRSSGTISSGGSPYAYTGIRPPSGSMGSAGAQRSSNPDPGIDFIPDGDAPAPDTPRNRVASSERSSEIPFGERFAGEHREPEKLSRGKSAEIPFEERFGSEHREPEKLPRGKSAEIPYSERRAGNNR